MDLEKLTLPLEVSQSAFNAGIKAAVAGVTALVGAMGLAIKGTFDWAAELDSIQDIIGGTNAEAAALNFTLRKSGTSTETFNKSLTIMNKGLVKSDGQLDTVGKSLASWGIDVKNANGQLKTQAQLIGEVSKKYNSFATQQERVNFLTEIYGRGGAEMIDFFDTLAGEGGIDAVTKKVEALGLAIDPARYEQFNRNLEELKMIGLGLAVSFTEKVMPILEKFLGWVGDFAASPEWANFKAGFNEFISRMATAIGEGDWEEVKNILFEKLNQFDDWIAEKFDAMDWSGAGASFGAALDGIMKDGVGKVDVPDSLESLFAGIDKFFQSAVGADKFGGWKNYFFVWGEQIKAGFGATLTNWKIEAGNFFIFAANDLMTNWAAHLSRFFQTAMAMIGGPVATFFATWTARWLSGVVTWGVTVYNKIIEWVNKILSAVNRVSGLSLGAPTAPTSPSTGGGRSGRSGNMRASGGAVIAGQQYSVAEFFKPEQYVPAQNGRIDPIQQGQQQPIDYDRLINGIGLRFAEAIQKL